MDDDQTGDGGEDVRLLGLEHSYRATNGNPVFAWRALALHLRDGVDLPAWAAGYFARCCLAVHDAAEDPGAARAFDARRAFGFLRRQGRGTVFSDLRAFERASAAHRQARLLVTGERWVTIDGPETSGALKVPMTLRPSAKPLSEKAAFVEVGKALGLKEDSTVRRMLEPLGAFEPWLRPDRRRRRRGAKS